MKENELRRAYKVFCEQLEPRVMITLATNQAWNIAKMTDLIEEFFGRLDRKGLGHTYNKAPPSARADGIFFIEKPDLNVHAHGLVTMPYGNDWGTQMIASLLWEKLCPGGSVDVQHIHSIEGAVHYCTKEMVSPHYQTEQVVLLRGLMSRKSLEARTN